MTRARLPGSLGCGSSPAVWGSPGFQKTRGAHPHRRTLAVLPSDAGVLPLREKSLFFYEAGLKAAGPGGNVEFDAGATFACPALPLADKDGAC